MDKSDLVKFMSNSVAAAIVKNPQFLDAVDVLVLSPLGKPGAIRLMSNSLACRLTVKYAEHITETASHLEALSIDVPKALPKAFGSCAALLDKGPQLCDRICKCTTRDDAEAYLITLGNSTATSAKRAAAALLPKV